MNCHIFPEQTTFLCVFQISKMKHIKMIICCMDSGLTKLKNGLHLQSTHTKKEEKLINRTCV